MFISKIKTVTVVLLASAVGGTGLAYPSQAQADGADGSLRKTESDAVPPRVPRPQGDARPSLPGYRNTSFGGGPCEPRYTRSGDIFLVTSPVGDKFSIYDAARDRASTVRLPGSAESPVEVVPVMGSGTLWSLMLNGQQITRIYIFSFPDWKWYPQDLKEPTSERVSPSVGRSVAALKLGRHVYAFSAGAKRWSVFDLPEGVDAQPVVQPDSVVVEYDGHVYEFSGETGEWKQYDFRALINAAIKKAEDKEN